MDLDFVIRNLSQRRKLFHSEADFQFALAEEIKKKYADSEVRLEYPINGKYIDIFILYGSDKIAIELKYKTAKMVWNDIHDPFNETYSLKDQSAPDLGRFDYLKDIERNESLIQSDNATVGFTVFITNYNVYWEKRKEENYTPKDLNFRIDEGKEISGKRIWLNNPSINTTGNERIGGVNLKGKYVMEWKPFSEIGDTSNSIFKYLLLKQSNL